MLNHKVPYDHPWDEILLGKLTEVIVGGTPSTAVARYWNGNIPWMSSGDVHMKRIVHIPGKITLEGLQSSNAKLIDPPAVAVALAGQGKTRGTAALILTKTSTNQSVAVIKPYNSQLNTNYLFHMLTFRYEELRSRSAGDGRAGLSKQLIEAVPIPVPTEIEQKQIAEILDIVDSEITQTENLIAKYQRIKTGLMQDLLTRGIDKHGNLRDPATHEFKASEIGRIPTEWEVKSLKEIAEVSSGVTLGRTLEGQNVVELPYLRVANVQDGYLDLSEVKTVKVYQHEVERYLLQSGDVLMNEGGDYDKLGRGAVWYGQITPCLHQNHVFRVRPNKSSLLPEYLALVSESPYGKQFFILNSKQSTNLASINSTQLKTFPIPSPNLDEQHRIIKALAVCDNQIEQELSQHQKLQRIKSGLMQDLLTGKVSVAPLLDDSYKEESGHGYAF